MSESPPRAILHVDMDAFFAAVEALDNPQLKDQPVVVGGLGPRGVVATANYAARVYGVHSAMPMGRARRLCPGAQFIRPRMARYRELSSQVFAVFHAYTPLVEGLSLDEAFLDVSGSVRLFGPAEEIAQQVKTHIRQSTGLTASVGVAHNKFLAKLASDLEKPDGLVCVPPDRVHEFLDPMPIRRLWGIGPRTAPRLKALGLLTFGQLRRARTSILQPVLGNRTEHFRRLAAGEDDRAVEPHSPDKSISHEITFDTDLTESETLRAELQGLSEAVASRLRARRLLARTVVIKVRDASFHTVTRSRSMPAGSSSTRTLYHVARALFETWRAANRKTAVRLLGMGVSGLESGFSATATAGDDNGDLRGDLLGDLLADSPELRGDKRVDELFDEINRRYGASKIVHGQTLRRRRDESKKS